MSSFGETDTESFIPEWHRSRFQCKLAFGSYKTFFDGSSFRFPKECNQEDKFCISPIEGAAPILFRVLKLLGLLIMSWCVMTFVHEAGHILCGYACGGILTAADLRPWHLPYSFFDPDPHPLVTLWGGPLLGAFIPLGMALIIRKDWFWFVAHFCVLANGVYIATAWVTGDRYLDTPKLLEQGAHPSSIAIYCAVTIGAGYVGFRRQCVRLLSPIPDSIEAKAK